MLVSSAKQLYTSICFEWPERLLYIRAILVVIGGFTVNITLSTVWTFGNMEPYIVSYIRNRSHPTNLRETIGPWVFTAIFVGEGTAAILGGWLYSKIGPRATTLIGGWTMSAGVLLSYFTIQTSFWLFIFTYGIMVGIGIGIAYVSPLSAAMKWMPDWKGVANGIVLAGYGIGMLMFDTVQTIFTNPNNIPVSAGSLDEKYFTDPEVLDRIPNTFLVLGGTYVVLQLLGSLLLTDPPEHYLQEQIEGENADLDHNCTKTCCEVNDENHSWVCCSETIEKSFLWLKNTITSSLAQRLPSPIQEEKDKDCSSDNQSDKEKEQLLRNLNESTPSDIGNKNSTNGDVIANVRPLQMLKQPNFYLLWFIVMLNGIAIYFMTTYYTVIGFTTIADDHFLAVVGVVSALCDTTGSIVWGLLADKLSYKVALVILNAAFTVFLLTFYASSIAGKPMFIIWAGILWFIMAGFFIIYPTAIARSFGLKYVSTNFALLFTSQIVASITSSLIDTFLHDYITVYGTLFLVSGLTFLSFVLVMIYQPKRYILLTV